MPSPRAGILKPVSLLGRWPTAEYKEDEMKSTMADQKEVLILNQNNAVDEMQPMDPEMLLLVYFDLEDLVELTPGELRLLKAASRERVEEEDNSAHIAEDILGRIRKTLVQPKA